VTKDTGRYKTPGELVQTAREERGLSLEDLSAQTRIPLRSLASLEQDDFEALAGPLYIRSFLKSLAVELGLDMDLLLERYDHLAGPAEEPGSEADEESTWETETRIRHVAGFPWRLILISLSALILIVLVVMIVRAFSGGSIESKPATEEISHSPDSTLTPVITEPSGELLPETTDELPAEPVDNTTVPESLPAGSSELVFDGGKQWPLVLRLVMTNSSELAVSTDGHPVDVDWDQPGAGVPSEDMVPGRVYRAGSRSVVYFGAESYFVVTLGAVEGVIATLNDSPLVIPASAVGNEWMVFDNRPVQE
jgi:cytoskeletal protein RodZ